MADDRNDIDKPLTMEDIDGPLMTMADIQAKSDESINSLLGVKVGGERFEGKDRNAIDIGIVNPVSTYWGVIFSLKGLDKEQHIPIDKDLNRPSKPLDADKGEVAKLTKKIRPKGNVISALLPHAIELGFFKDSTSVIWHSDIKYRKPFTRMNHGKPSPHASDDIKKAYESTASPLVKFYKDGDKLTAGMLLPMIHVSEKYEKGVSSWFKNHKDNLIDKISHSPVGKHLSPELFKIMKKQFHTDMKAGVFASVTATKKDISQDASTYTGSLANGIEGVAVPLEIKLPDQFSIMNEKDKDSSTHNTSKSTNTELVDMFRNNLRKLYKNEVREAKAALKTIVDCAAGGATKTIQAIKASRSLPSLAILGLEKLGKEGILEVTASQRTAFLEKAEQAMEKAIDEEINERYSGRTLEVEFTLGALTSNTCTIDPEMVKKFDTLKILPPDVEKVVRGLKKTAKFIIDTGEKFQEEAQVVGEVLYAGVDAMAVRQQVDEACSELVDSELAKGRKENEASDIGLQCVQSVTDRLDDMPAVPDEAIDFSIREFQSTLPTIKSDTVLSKEEKYEKEQEAATEKDLDILNSIATADNIRDNANITETDNTELSVDR